MAGYSVDTEQVSWDTELFDLVLFYSEDGLEMAIYDWH